MTRRSLDPRRHVRGQSAQWTDRWEQPVWTAPDSRSVQRGCMSAALVVPGAQCMDASCCVVCCLSDCTEV